MKRFLVAAAFLSVLGSRAQTEEPSVAAERERLRSEKAKVESEFVAQQKVCYAKFAVNDCLAAARAKRRQALSDLHRQELALNEEQRKRKAAERRGVLDERNAEQARRQEAAQQRGASQVEDKQQRASDRAAARASQALSAPEKARERSATVERRQAEVAETQRQRAEAAAKNAQDYDKRQAQAEEHRRKVQGKQAERNKPPASALPTPP